MFLSVKITLERKYLLVEVFVEPPLKILPSSFIVSMLLVEKTIRVFSGVFFIGVFESYKVH